MAPIDGIRGGRIPTSRRAGRSRAWNTCVPGCIWRPRSDEAMKRSALVASLVLCASQAPFAWQQPAFSSKVEAVRVDVLVTDKGQPIRGLSIGDFDLLDNGVPQQLDLVSFEQIPLNLVLVLDM